MFCILFLIFLNFLEQSRKSIKCKEAEENTRKFPKILENSSECKNFLKFRNFSEFSLKYPRIPMTLEWTVIRPELKPKQFGKTCLKRCTLTVLQ